MPLSVSAIVPTYNRKGPLQECLSSLLGQQFEKSLISFFEIVVADDGSIDGTRELVAELAENSRYPIRYVFQENKGPGAARNLGIRTAKGEILAFTDADMTVPPDWISIAAGICASQSAAGVEGRTISLRDKSFQSRREAGDDSLYSHSADNPLGGYGTGNIFYRRAVLVEVGGFDTAFFLPSVGLHFREDSDLAFSVLERGNRIVSCPDLVAFHGEIPTSIWTSLKLEMRHFLDPLLRRKHPQFYGKNLGSTGIPVPGFGRISRELLKKGLSSLYLLCCIGLAASGPSLLGFGLLTVALGCWVILLTVQIRRVGLRSGNLLPLALLTCLIPVVIVLSHLCGEIYALIVLDKRRRKKNLTSWEGQG